MEYQKSERQETLVQHILKLTEEENAFFLKLLRDMYPAAALEDAKKIDLVTINAEGYALSLLVSVPGPSV